MLKLLASATLICALPAFAAETPSAKASAEALACTAQNPSGGDIRVVTCLLPAGRAYRFTANFSGGHDDTSASLSAVLDEQPTNCDAGSKMRLFAEEGDVSLHCRISATGDAAAKHTLIVTVLWSHAQFRDFRFAVD